MTFVDGKYETPTCCSICKGKSLQPNRQSAVTVDWQRIRLQEIVSDESRQTELFDDSNLELHVFALGITTFALLCSMTYQYLQGGRTNAADGRM